MKNNIEICNEETCSKQVISFSSYCGEHSNYEMVHKELMKLTGEVGGLFLSELNLIDIVFKDLKFDNLTISSCSFEDVQFINCEFLYGVFTTSKMVNMKFANCSFVDLEWKNMNFGSEAILDNCLFERCSFMTCHFNENPILINTSFKFSEFISCTFFEIEDFKEILFENCEILSSSFSEISGKEVSFISCNMEETNLENSSFFKSKFENVENDFGGLDVPKLCDFSNTSFHNTELPDEFYIWNNTKEEKLPFYTRLINEVKFETHAENLWVLNASVDRLNELGVENDIGFIETIMSVYKEKWESYVSNQDYGVLANIIESYDDLPVEFKNIKPLLPSPKAVSSDDSWQISITADCENWSLQNIQEFQVMLYELELLIPSSQPLEVVSIQKGSIIQLLLGEADKILTLATAFASVTSFLMVTAKGYQHLRKERLQIQKQEKELKFIDQNQELDIEKKKTEIAKDKLELLNQSMKLLNSICEEQNLDLQTYLNTDAGKTLLQKVSLINDQYPIKLIELIAGNDKSNKKAV